MTLHLWARELGLRPLLAAAQNNAAVDNLCAGLLSLEEARRLQQSSTKSPDRPLRIVRVGNSAPGDRAPPPFSSCEEAGCSATAADVTFDALVEAKLVEDAEAGKVIGR